jgi:hypothetical protein
MHGENLKLSSGYLRQCCHINYSSDRYKKGTDSVTVNVNLMLKTVISGAIYTPHSFSLSDLVKITPN